MLFFSKVKKIVGSVSLSHVLTFFSGILIPIYLDVLFLHSYDASTLSAMWDTVTGILAIIAAFTVVSWMKDKVNNRAFKQAEEIIDGYANLNIDKTYLLLEAEHLIDSMYNLNGIVNGYPQKTNFKKFNENLDKAYRNHLLMRSKYTGLKTWGVKPKDHLFFVNLRQNYEFFFEALISISKTEDEPNMVIRDRSYDMNKRKMYDFYKGISKLSNKLSEPFEQIFVEDN